MIKAVIFDLDGTTIDTVKSIAYYVNETLKKFGYGEIEVEKFNILAGNGPKNLIHRSLECVGGDQNLFDEFFKSYVDSYNSNVFHLSEPFEGIVKLLEDLKANGIKTAIVSNKQDKAVKILSEHFFGDLVDLNVGFKEGIALKPAPDSLLNTMKELGVEKDEVLFVGDTDVDMITAKNAGVKSIGVLWGFRGEEELKSNGADYIVSNAKEIFDLTQVSE